MEVLIFSRYKSFVEQEEFSQVKFKTSVDIPMEMASLRLAACVWRLGERLEQNTALRAVIAQLTLHWREDNIRDEGKDGQENICTFKWCKN